MARCSGRLVWLVLHIRPRHLRRRLPRVLPDWAPQAIQLQQHQLGHEHAGLFPSWWLSSGKLLLWLNRPSCETGTDIITLLVGSCL